MFADDGDINPLDADQGMARLQNELDLPLLAEFAAGSECLGVTRFCDCGDGTPDQVLTCSWLPSLVLVECVTGWSKLPREERVGPRQTIRWVGRVPYILLPRKLRGWEQLRESLAAAPSCHGCSGIGITLFFHGLLADGTIANVVWSDPHPRRHRPQTDCIAAYRWLARISRLCSLLPVQGTEKELSRGATGRLAWTVSPI